MFVVFIHGPAAAGKLTIATALCEQTGLKRFHNHLAVDVAKSLFEFGTPSFRTLRATIWLTAFREAAAAGTNFVFTFNPEATVDPVLIQQMCEAVYARGGRVHFVELRCSEAEVLRRLGNASRRQFGKMVDAALYQQISRQGGFRFPPLPEPLLRIDTEACSPLVAASQIISALVPLEPELSPLAV
jgi:hypothetical protein